MKFNQGFIALMSVIIISTILLVLIVAGSLVGWYSRFNILDAESKERSSALADACVDQLLLEISFDPSYPTSQKTVALGSDTCTIAPQNGAGKYPVQATFNGAYTNLLVGVDPDGPSVTSWQEVGLL